MTLPNSNAISNHGYPHTLPTPGSHPEGIACAPDNSVWYAAAAVNKVGRLRPDRLTFDEFPVPTEGSSPHGIAVGPDGTIWFTESATDKIGRLQLHPQGDVNADGAIDIADVFYLINFLFASGPGPIGPADVNGDLTTDIADVFYLINALFAGGPAPV